MATISEDSIRAFMRYTDTSYAYAFQMLQRYDGDLTAAVNSFRRNRERNVVHEAPGNVPQNDEMNINDVIPAARSPLTVARTMGPSSLSHSNFGRNINDNDLFVPSPPPFGSHPREVRQIPIEVKNSSGPSKRSRGAPNIEDVTEISHLPARRSRQEQPHGRHKTRRVESGSVASRIADHSRSRSPEGINPAHIEWDLPYLSPEQRAAPRPPSPSFTAQQVRPLQYLPAQQRAAPRPPSHSPSLPAQRLIREQQVRPLPSLPAQQRAVPRPPSPSPSLIAHRLIREQQDNEYQASLQADRDKELKSIRDAEARQLEEETARKALLEEAQRKLMEEQDLKRQLDAKAASLPKEPDADEENSINILVRMPDGARHGRRFLKSNKLQSVFDFIDIASAMKHNPYKLVKACQKRTFGDGERDSTLNELELNSKQEALFLEPVCLT